MDRAVQIVMPLLSFEAEQWQNNLLELYLSTRLILGKAEKTDKRLELKIVSQNCFTEIAFGTSSEESVAKGESLR